MVFLEPRYDPTLAVMGTRERSIDSGNLPWQFHGSLLCMSGLSRRVVDLVGSSWSMIPI